MQHVELATLNSISSFAWRNDFLTTDIINCYLARCLFIQRGDECREKAL